jgi:hypothetical protein
MALRVIIGWVGVNLAALALLAIVDVLRVARSGLGRLMGKPQPAGQRR